MCAGDKGKKRYRGGREGKKWDGTTKAGGEKPLKKKSSKKTKDLHFKALTAREEERARRGRGRRMFQGGGGGQHGEDGSWGGEKKRHESAPGRPEDSRLSKKGREKIIQQTSWGNWD